MFAPTKRFYQENVLKYDIRSILTFVDNRSQEAARMKAIVEETDPASSI